MAVTVVDMAMMAARMPDLDDNLCVSLRDHPSEHNDGEENCKEA